MQVRIFGIFSNVNHARSALGQIKKTAWNQAEVLLIYADNISENEHSFDQEIASEGFIGNNPSAHAEQWSGLKDGYLDGIGAVKYGALSGQSLDTWIKKGEINWIRRELTGLKIIAVVETTPELVPELHSILQNYGAEVQENGYC